jgi:hypothetical protein
LLTPKSELVDDQVDGHWRTKLKELLAAAGADVSDIT